MNPESITQSLLIKLKSIRLISCALVALSLYQGTARSELLMVNQPLTRITNGDLMQTASFSASISDFPEFGETGLTQFLSELNQMRVNTGYCSSCSGAKLFEITPSSFGMAFDHMIYTSELSAGVRRRGLAISGDGSRDLYALAVMNHNLVKTVQFGTVINSHVTGKQFYCDKWQHPSVPTSYDCHLNVNLISHSSPAISFETGEASFAMEGAISKYTAFVAATNPWSNVLTKKFKPALDVTQLAGGTTIYTNLQQLTYLEVNSLGKPSNVSVQFNGASASAIIDFAVSTQEPGLVFRSLSSTGGMLYGFDPLNLIPNNQVSSCIDNRNTVDPLTGIARTADLSFCQFNFVLK